MVFRKEVSSTDRRTESQNPTNKLASDFLNELNGLPEGVSFKQLERLANKFQFQLSLKKQADGRFLIQLACPETEKCISTLFGIFFGKKEVALKSARGWLSERLEIVLSR